MSNDIIGNRQEAFDVLFSNLKGEDDNLANFNLVSSIINVIDISRFDLNVLDQVFDSFIDALGQTPRYTTEVFDTMKANEQLKQPVIFHYENLEWRGKIIWHKWCNVHDNNNTWNTYSIKLPNNRYLYNISNEKKENGHSYLQDSSTKFLKNAIQFSLQFFDDEDLSIRIFYLTKKSRLNIKVRSDKHKAWLKITYEYGYPKQSAMTGWYTKKKMLELLK